MTTAVATLNMRNTATPYRIGPQAAERGLVKVLATGNGVDLIGLQEWAGGPRNAILRRRGVTLFVGAKPRLDLKLPAAGYTWVRPVLGGPWVGAKGPRFRPLFVRSKTLAPAGRLERVPGFRSLLGASKVTVAGFHDLALARTVVVINGHLTRHVEKGGHYRSGLPKTVARHRREVAALNRVIRYHRNRGRIVYVTIDGNYDGLDLDGVVECWEGHPRSETGGTLGSRRPEVIAGPTRARDVYVVETASDHDAVVAVYR